MQEFFFRVPITGGREVAIRELKNREYRVLLRYILEDDKEFLNEYVNFIIENILKNKEDYGTLSYIDKVIILLVLRVVSIDEYISSTDPLSGLEEEQSLMILVNAIIEKTENISLTNELSLTETIKVGVSVPRDIFYSDKMDVMESSISYIRGEQIDIAWGKLQPDDREKIQNQFPPEFFKEIFEAAAEYDSKVLVSIKLEFLENFFSIADFNFSYFSGGMAKFIIALYTQDYKEFIKRQIIFFQDLRSDMSHFDSITMSDVKAFISIFNEMMDERKPKEKDASQHLA